MRQEAGFRCVEYSVCADQLSPLLPGGDDAAPPGFSFDTAPDDAQARVDDDCLSDSIDVISIPESAGTCNPTGAASAAVHSRYCGQFLNFVSGVTANSVICGE